MADPVSASESNSFTITIDDSSPTVLYAPYTPMASNLSAGWNTISIDSGFDDDSGQSGEEVTLHATAADGASVSFRWTGTGISVYGNFTPSRSSPNANGLAAYSVTLDGTPTTNFVFSSTSNEVSHNVLASFRNLNYAEHVVALAAYNPDSLSDGSVLLQFDHADLVSGVPPKAVVSEHSSSSTIAITQIIPEDGISFQGQWSFQSSLLPGTNIGFHTSNKVGDRASLIFNGTAITISGLTTLVSGSYNVSIDDEAPLTLSARATFNASAPTVLYYRTGLDPAAMHLLSFVNAGAVVDDTAGNFLALASASVTSVEINGISPPSSDMSSRPPRGKTATIAVCASLAFIVLLFIIGIFMRRRRRSSQRKQGLIQNPRLNRLRRFSFMSRTVRSQHDDSEKQTHEFDQEEPHESDQEEIRRSSEQVLDITGKSAEDMDEDDMEDLDPNARTVRREGRVASQNSDGSFAIDLPRLPDRGYVRTAQADSRAPPRDSIPNSPIVFRTSRPRGPRDMRASLNGHGREGSHGILLSDVGRSDEDPSSLPHIEVGSPLRVNFQDVSLMEMPSRPEEEHLNAEGSSIPPSLKLVLFGHDPTPVTTAPVTPITPSGDPQISFLDMESSTSTSMKSSARSARQSAAESTRSSFKSRPEYTTTGYAVPPPDNRKSLALSMNIGGGPTSSRPSLSPSISLQPIPLSSLPSQRPTLDALSSSDADKHQALDTMPSPTDSLPLTVSDIHFRHSSYSTFSQPSDSHRASAANRSSGSQRPPHPPLPKAPENKPFIVKKLLGMHGPAPPVAPFSSPVTPGFSVVGTSTGRVATSPMSPVFSFISTRDSNGRTK